MIIVGGFLGSGKTTLLWNIASRLTGQGKAVGLITNDQSPDLVDTALLSHSGADVTEVTGSCFCCNFEGLINAVKSMIEKKADVIIAEPVGSCTDLSATIMQPLKDKYPEIDLAPFTVLADPGRVLEALDKKSSLMHPSARYIMRKQMEESDIILLNKIDTLSPDDRRLLVGLLCETFPGSDVGEISAFNGDGIDGWLASVLAADKAGSRLVDIDYDTYAEGEAVLGWLNAIVGLESGSTDIDWEKYAKDTMERLAEECRQHNAEVGHVKLVIESDGKRCMANLTQLCGEIVLHGNESLTGAQANLILNARVQMPPEKLEEIVRLGFNASGKNSISATIRTFSSIMPGRPNPTYRYSHTV